MKNAQISIFLMMAVLIPGTVPFSMPQAQAQSAVELKTLGFPESVQVTQGKNYTLFLTGTGLRKKWGFKVYKVAHYMEALPKGADLNRKALEDGPAKQLTIHYLRNVPGDKVQNVLREGFLLNADADELRVIREPMLMLLKACDAPVKKGDVFTLRWFKGGRIVIDSNGTERGSVENVIFARVLWSIWCGDQAVVDRNLLLARAGS